MKSIFEQLGGTYHEENGYLIPDLRLPKEEEKEIGIWGQRHLEYLKQYPKGRYINLLTSGRLNTYLADIDKQSQERQMQKLSLLILMQHPFHAILLWMFPL